MKKIFILFAVFVASQAFSQVIWTNGNSNNLFNDAGNWSTNSIPTTTDDIVFDGSAVGNCSLTLPIDVNSIDIQGGYTGTIDGGGNDVVVQNDLTMADGVVNVGSGNFDVFGICNISNGTFNCNSGTLSFYGLITLSGGTFNANTSSFNVYGVPSLTQSNGTFNGSTSSVYLAGAFSLSGGTFNAPSTVMTIEGNLTRTAGTFNHNNGTVDVNRSNAANFTLSGTWAFNVFEITASGGNSTRSINFNSSSTTASLILNAGNYANRYSGNITITSNLTISGTTTTPVGANTGTFTFSGAGPISIVGTNSVNNNPIANVNINTAGAVSMSNQINIRGRWTNTNAGSYSAGTSTVHFLGSAAQLTGGTTNTTRANFDNISIQSGGTLAVQGSSQFNLHRNMTNDGTFSGSTGLVRFNGTVAQSLNGVSTTTFNAIEISNTGTKTFSSPALILDSVGVSAAGTLAAGGNLTLRSVAAQKARIGRIAAGGDVTGNVVVQNYFPGGWTGWTNLCSPGLSGQTMASWNSAFAITCSACPIASVGGVAFESIYSYDETLGAGSSSNAAHYIPINGLGDPIVPTAGYYVYLGDGPNTTNDITAVMTGPINKNNSFGGYNLSLTGGLNVENGWNLISNPYPAPISLVSMFAGNLGNVDNTIQLWSPENNGGNGGFTLKSIGGAGDIVPMGQGFFVRALVNGVALTGSESWKNVSNASVEKTFAQSGFNFNDLFKINLTGSSKGFDTYVYFDFKSEYTPGFDNGRDVYFLDNASQNMVAQIYARYNNDNYTSGAFPALAPNSSMTIPLHIPTGYTGVYKLEGMNFNKLPGYCFELKDLVNNVTHNLNNSPYTVNFTANDGAVAKFELKITNCGISAVGITENTISGNLLINKNNNGVYVQSNFEANTNATISVTNILGQKIMDDKKVNTKNEKIYLDIAEKNQMILVTVTTQDGLKITKKIVH